MKNPSDLTGDQICNLPQYSTVPQATAPSHTSLNGTISTCNQDKLDIVTMSLSRNF